MITKLTIKDLNLRCEHELITDSQDRKAVADYLGENLDYYKCLFVKVANGELTEVYGTFSNVPFLHLPIDRIK